MTRPTVIVTACGCPGGPSVVRALHDDFRVVATDCDPAASGRYYADAFYVTRRGNHALFATDLLELAEREGAAAVLPESSSEVLALARARGEFEDMGVQVLVSRPGAVIAALDKGLTYRAMEGAGVPLPRYEIVGEFEIATETWHRMVNAIMDLGYPDRPVVIKRPTGKGGRGFWIVEAGVNRLDLDMRQWPNARRLTLDELTAWALRHFADPGGLGRWLVMEYLEGDESSADTFDGFGTALGFTKIRRACHSGVHWRHEARYDARLMDYGRRTVERLGLEYFVNVQFMAGKLLEVNPRISTQILAPGFNLPALGVKLALGLIDRAEVRLPDGTRAQYFLDLRSYEE